MGIFLFSERKVYSNAVWRRDTQETSFPLLSHSQVDPKIDFPSHEDALTEGNTFIHALQGDLKLRTHMLQILPSFLKNWNRKGEIKTFWRSPCLFDLPKSNGYLCKMTGTFWS